MTLGSDNSASYSLYNFWTFRHFAVDQFFKSLWIQTTYVRNDLPISGKPFVHGGSTLTRFSPKINSETSDMLRSSVINQFSRPVLRETNTPLAQPRFNRNIKFFRSQQGINLTQKIGGSSMNITNHVPSIKVVQVSTLLSANMQI